MKFLRQQLDMVAPLFEKGGKLERLYPLYEANDTFLYTPGEVTDRRRVPCARLAIDLKRMMSTVIVALIPCIFMGDVQHGLPGQPRDLRTWAGGGHQRPGWRDARGLAWRADVRQYFGDSNYDSPEQYLFVRACLDACCTAPCTFCPSTSSRWPWRRLWEVIFAASAQSRNQRGLPRHGHAVSADAAADDSAVAGGARDHLRRRDRQGDVLAAPARTF